MVEPIRVDPITSTSSRRGGEPIAKKTTDLSSATPQPDEKPLSPEEQERRLLRFRRRQEAEAPIDLAKLSMNPIIAVHKAAQEVSSFGKANLKGAKDHIKESEKLTAAASKEKVRKHEEGAKAFWWIQMEALGLGGASLLLTLFQDRVAANLSNPQGSLRDYIPLPNSMVNYISNIPGKEWSQWVGNYGNNLLQSNQQEKQNLIGAKTQFADQLYQLLQVLEKEARERQSSEERTDQEHTQTLAKQGVDAMTKVLTGGRV